MALISPRAQHRPRPVPGEKNGRAWAGPGCAFFPFQGGSLGPPPPPPFFRAWLSGVLGPPPCCLVGVGA